MDTNIDQKIANQAAQLSADSARLAAKEQIAATVQAAQYLKDQAADKAAPLKDKVGDLMSVAADKAAGLKDTVSATASTLGDKLKSAAAGALDSTADFAERMADKLKH